LLLAAAAAAASFRHFQASSCFPNFHLPQANLKFVLTAAAAAAAGGASDQLNYVGANQASNVRSENVALGSNENIDFDFGRRRLAAAAQRRRLQGSQRGSGAALGRRRQ
jgi:hypothetical protein